MSQNLPQIISRNMCCSYCEKGPWLVTKVREDSLESNQNLGAEKISIFLPITEQMLNDEQMINFIEV